jgi:small conductance mechanosensitive channel
VATEAQGETFRDPTAAAPAVDVAAERDAPLRAAVAPGREGTAPIEEGPRAVESGAEPLTSQEEELLRRLEALRDDPLAAMQEEVAWFTAAWESLIDFALAHLFQLAGGAVILLIGVLLANRLARFVLSVQEKRNVDVTLRQFISSVVRLSVLAVFVVIAVENIGISVAPFLAAIGGLALGASFALQLPVSNYGAGLVIILTRPFRVGDTLRVVDQYGLVEEINLAMTHMTNEDGELIVIPNKHLIGEILVNSHANRVVEGVVRIAYGDDPERAIEAVQDVLGRDPDVVARPPAQVGIQAFAETGMELSYRFWVPTTSFFEVQYRVNLAIWQALREAGLSVPYPRADVNLVTRALPG